MMDVIKFIDKIIDKISKKPGEEPVRLCMGDVKEVLLPCSRLFYKHGQYGMNVTGVPGFAWKRKRFRLYLRPGDEPNPHIVIAGMSGFGKSSLFKHMLVDLARARIPCIVFDAHNEHEALIHALNGTVYDARYSGINPMELAGATVAERISELTRMFKGVYSLGYIQATKLSQCLWYVYRKAGAADRLAASLDSVPTIRELLRELNVFISNAKGIGEKNTLLHLYDRLSLLDSAAFSSSVSVQELGNGVCSFSLAGMKSREVQVIYIGELLRRLYQQMHSSSKEQGLRMCIAIDEVQFLTDSSDASGAVIRSLIEEGRKYGMGIIIVAHAASGLSRQIVANASTLVAFYAREPSEASYVAKLLAGNDAQRAYVVMEKLRVLGQHEAIMVSCNARNPLFVATPRIKELDMHLKLVRAPTACATSCDAPGMLARARKPVSYDDLIKEYGVQAVEEQVAKGVLSKLAIKWQGKEEKWLMLHNRAMSIEHRVYVQKIHELLDAHGIRNYVMGSSKGPDIVARCNNYKVAIEYETGRKPLRKSAEMIRSRHGPYSVVIVFTNSGAYRFYKSYFEDESVKVFDIGDAASAVTFLQEHAGQ
jgi:ABC-type dipeptide/oligopeptide/nickel transport system ATPase subunit